MDKKPAYEELEAGGQALEETGAGLKPTPKILRNCEEKLRRVEETQQKGNEDLEMLVKQRTAQLTEAYRQLQFEIIERQKVTAQLRESEKKYRQLFNHAPTGIYEIDLEKQKFVNVNDVMCEYTGYTKEEFLQLNPFDILTKDSQRQFEKRLNRLFAGQPIAATVEYKIRGKNGKEFWVMLNTKMLYDEDKPRSAAVVVHDITERKMIEEELRESQERYRQALENSPNPIFSVDSDGRIRTWNSACTRVFKYGSEIIGQKYTRLFPQSNNRASVETLVAKVFDKEALHEVELAFACRDGSLRFTVSRMFPVYNPDGQVARCILANTDITDRKHAEDELRREIEERKRVEVQIHTLTQQLIKAQESERQRIARDLHDHVAQDLSALKIGCETLFDDHPPVSPEIGQKLVELSRTLHRSIKAVRDLSYALHPPDLEEMGLAATVFKYSQEFAEKNGLTVNFHSAGMNTLKFDFDTEINLYRVIQEALTNIRKHADARRINIKMVTSYPNLILRIEDDGKGFDVEERLSSAINEKRMGLRNMQERVRLLKGKMRIQSRPTGGTEILIEVPQK
ncbi:MAG: PAS domain S-box protein [Desulfobacterales bacterium]|nr:MAG: PAS domain S-box protein [Desulfobacterales bacterium]